jgi:HSP20 family molecular chaperone IbpA
MSNVSAKNLMLSQRRGEPEEEIFLAILPHTSTLTEENTVVKVEIPGVDPSTVEVSCESNILQVHCERGSFTYSVDPTIDTSKIKADIQWGMLTLSIPVPPQPVARSIKINFHDAAPVKKPAAKVSEEA